MSRDFPALGITTDDDGWSFDGCYYDSPEDALWVGVMGMCGCGSPEQGARPVRWVLGRAWWDEHNPRGLGLGARLAARRLRDVGMPSCYESTATLLGAYVADQCGLTDHGTGMGWPYLTDKGREALGILDEAAKRGWLP